MKFDGELEEKTLTHVNDCNLHLTNPERIAAIRAAGLMSASREKSFERLAYLAAKSLNVPLTIVSVVTHEKQYFKGAFGLPEVFDKSRELPIDGSICRYTLNGKEIIASNAKLDPLLKHHPATGPWGIGAFIAIPIVKSDGHVLGAFCAVDYSERIWSESDIELMRELTHSVVTEISLKEKIKELEQERQVRERIEASMTHDLRNPLNIIKLSLSLLERKSNPDKELTQRIKNQVDHMDGLLSSILQTSRDQSLQTSPLQDIITSIISELEILFGKRFELTIENEISKQFDALAVKRIVENLLTNAAKYGEDETPIELKLSEKDNEALICIHNYGNPIDENDFKKIFHYHERTSNAINGSQTGWGIGLSIVKTLVQELNGSVEVRSGNNGTTFIVHLPL